MAHYDSEKNRFNPDNRFIGDIEDGKRYPFACYTKEESDAKYALISTSTDLTALTAVVATKAAQSDLTALSGVVDTKASQSDLNTLSGVVDTKASQADLVSLGVVVNSKAAQTDLNALSNVVDTKASASDLNTLSDTVATKANTSDLIALSGVVATKANQSALDMTNANLDTKASLTALADTNAIMATKANQTTVDTLTATVNMKANQADVDTLNDAIDTKANNSDLTTATANLQAQIDEIVTPVTQDAEVQTARVGFDGYSYTSLKSRLDGEASNFNNNIKAINSKLGTNCPAVANAIFAAETGGMADGTSTNRIRTDNIPIKKGDKVYIDGRELKHRVGVWEGPISTSDCVRNDNVGELWYTEPETVVAQKDGYICVVFAKSNDIALSPSDLRGEVVVFPYYAAGEDVEAIQAAISVDPIAENSPAWKMGYLSSENGAPMSSSTGEYYILTDYISAEGISSITITCQSDFKAKLFGYDSNRIGIGSEYNYYGGSKTWNVLEASFYRVGIKRDPVEVIDPNSINSNVLISKIPYIADLYNRSNVQDFPVVSLDIKEKIDIETDILRYNTLFNNCGANVESLLFFSDPHIYKNTSYPLHQEMLAEIQKAYNKTPTSVVICGGDWLMDNDTQAQACNKLAYVKGVCDNVFRDNILHCLGNHDTNYQGVDGQGTANAGKLSDNTLNALWFNKYGQRYYKYQSVHTAFYILDTGTDWETEITEYRQNQLIWLANSIKDETGNVAIVMHIYTNLDIITPFATEIGKIITAYNGRGTYGIGSELISFASCTGKIRFVLTGHEHKDFNTTVANIPVVGIINTMNSEQISFDMIFIDYDNNSMKCIRTGLGSDREFTLV